MTDRRKCGSSPAPRAGWASNSPKPYWRLATHSSPSGRDTDRLSKALGASSNLLTVKLDVTRPADAEAAVKAAVDRFGRIDVLINNAASFYAGYFEELTPEQMNLQLADEPRRSDERHARRAAGHAKAALRTHHRDLFVRWSFGLRVRHRLRRVEVRPRRVHGIAARRKSRRSESTRPSSIRAFSERSCSPRNRRTTPTGSIGDYAERRDPLVAYWKSMNGKQTGDPAKLARAIITIARAVAAASPLHRRRGCDRRRGAEDRCPEGGHRIQPSALDIARLRQLTADVRMEFLYRTGGRRGSGDAVYQQLIHHDPGGSRTRDLRIKSPLLYQLSYRV